MININEIFYTLQGEGALSGMPCVFIRLSGCPLKCVWCDTKYAWDENSGKDYTIKQIIETVNSYNTDYVAITGGEPMMNTAISELCNALRQQEKHITIETAGLKYVPDLPIDLMSVSPKLANAIPESAQQEDYINVETLNMLIENYPCQLKFVVCDESDMPEVVEIVQQLPGCDPAMVMLMPQAIGKDEYLEIAPVVAELCKEYGYCFSPRLQAILWDNKRGS